MFYSYFSSRQTDVQHSQVPIKIGLGTSNCWNASRNKFVLCCSALTVEERVKNYPYMVFSMVGLAKQVLTSSWYVFQEIVSNFVRLSRATVLKKWDSSVTHVIASTDENGACKRTLKFLMAILEGKWILNVECQYQSITT